MNGLRLSNAGRARHAAGEIVNYMSVDCYRLGEFPWYFHQITIVPLQLLISSSILFSTLGWATFAGLALISLTMLINFPLARALQIFQVKLMGAQDERVRASSEILNSIKIIKLQVALGLLTSSYVFQRALIKTRNYFLYAHISPQTNNVHVYEKRLFRSCISLLIALLH